MFGGNQNSHKELNNKSARGSKDLTKRQPIKQNELFYIIIQLHITIFLEIKQIESTVGTHELNKQTQKTEYPANADE